MTKLNIGSGSQVGSGWTCLDRAFTPETVEKAAQIPTAQLIEIELTDGPLPFPDASVRFAVAHHSLCMFAAADLRALMVEVARVLEVGGVLRVSSVDFRHAMRALAEKDVGWFHALGVPASLDIPAFAFVWYLDWGGARKTPFYCPEQLGLDYITPTGMIWETVSFEETISKSPAICDFDSRADESWFMDCIKL